MKRNQKSKTTDILQLNYINDLIQDGSKRDRIDANDVSDGYHTFGQLYDCRLAYNAALFNEWANPNIVRFHTDLTQFDNTGTTKGNQYNVHKSLDIMTVNYALAVVGLLLLRYYLWVKLLIIIKLKIGIYLKFLKQKKL